MTSNSSSFSRTGVSLACVGLLALLSACGGGGGGGGGFPIVAAPVAAAPPPPSPPPPAQALDVTVVDGALANAVVFLDKNNNGLLDGGEPNGKTNGAGKSTLQVDPADVGKWPVVALVGTDAVDADFGPVTSAYVLKAPADRPGLVSPLTTLVQRQAESAGVTSDEAEANVRSQLGLAASLFDDYSAATGDRVNATHAAALVQIAQKIAGNLAASLGQPDSTGAPISAGDIAKETQNMLLDKLTSIRGILAGSFQRNSCASGVGSDACKSVLSALADYYATSPLENQLTAATIGSAVGIGRQIAAAGPWVEPAPAPGASLDWFYLADNNNWYWRAFVATTEENTEVNGTKSFRERRQQNVAGVQASWGFGSSPDRAGDLFWNGSAWVGCPVDFKNASTARDAQGRSTSDYCGGLNVTKSRRVDVDIAGKKLADVVNQIKAFPYTSGGPYGTRYASWGPQGTPTAINTSLGDAVFPAGASLIYQNGLEVSSAMAYDLQEANKVGIFAADVAAGGDARANAALPCNATTPAPTSVLATTLEQLIERFPGAACIFNPGTLTGAGGAVLESGPRNEAWGLSSLSIGISGSAPLGTAATATAYYTSNRPIRVSFAGGGSTAVTFHECQQRAINGSIRNCSPVGTGTYKIESLGDARVLSFSGDVGGFSVFLSYDRVFVERAGAVYYGYRSKLAGSKRIRLNLPATNTLFSAYATQGAVGLAPITP